MLYIKTWINEETIITTEITPDNVYTHCDNCGREIHVNLFDLLPDSDDDTEEPDRLCCRCTRKLHPGFFKEAYHE